MIIANTEIPGFFCSDPEVQAFCTSELWHIGPYAQPDLVRSGRELFQAARDRFGDYRCWDLTIWLH